MKELGWSRQLQLHLGMKLRVAKCSTPSIVGRHARKHLHIREEETKLAARMCSTVGSERCKWLTQRERTYMRKVVLSPPWVADDKELDLCSIDAKAMPPQSLSALGIVDHSCLD